MTLVLCRSVEFAPQVSPYLRARLDMPYQTRHELGWDMAVGATRANTELIRVMHALRQFLEGRVHFMAGSTKRDGFSVLQSADETAGKSDSHDEGNEPTGRDSEEKPALGEAPEPRREALGRGRCPRFWLWRCHVALSLALGQSASPDAVACALAYALSAVGARGEAKCDVHMSARQSHLGANGCLTHRPRGLLHIVPRHLLFGTVRTEQRPFF